MKKRFVLLMLSACVSWPAGSGFAQSQHDIGGVGAMGLIGRGVTPEERPSVYEPAPIQYQPIYVPVPVAAPVVAAPVVAPSRPASVARPASVPGREAVDATVARQPARARNNPYVWYERSWLLGYWSVPVRRGSAARATFATGGGTAGRSVLAGRGTGWGLASWLIGPMVYRWGYLDYRNPFHEAAPADAARAAVHDYAHPIDLAATPPPEAALYDGLRRFAEAREAFLSEDYTGALQRADEAVGLIPDAPSLHYFRGFTLLALHRYDEAAAVFHAAIAVVPGWDWKTTAKLYSRPETYTRQLRLLESYTEQHPRSAAAHFLLAVQYLTTGFADAALDQLRQVAALRPDDPLTARLLVELQTPPAGAGVGASGRGGQAGDLQGTWTARPREGTTITMTIRPHGHVTWSVVEGGPVRRYEGFGLHADGVLTLTEDAYNSMAGRVIWADPTHFTFRVLEDRPGNPGLSFAKAP